MTLKMLGWHAGRQRLGSAVTGRPSRAAANPPAPVHPRHMPPEPPPRPLTFKGVWAAQGEQEAGVAILNLDRILAVSVHILPLL